ncbi:hypothetical protein H9L25_00255 [Terrisporobacter mayombei]|nr:hypothetical protein [Terrisporobacter mayombei]
MAIQYIPPTVTKANRIKIDDINNNFESNNVEGALNEVCKKVKDQVQIDLNTYATKEELETKVDKEVGKSLIDDTEIERLKTVTNYNDTEIKASLEQKADKVELHLHENKSVLDGINQEKIDEWDKGIVFEDSPINDANNWKTFGYTKTNNTTINLPPQCSNDSDKWGILQIVKQHPTSGTQLYYPIDGQYKGRVFVRLLKHDTWYDWSLLSIFSGSYNDLTEKPNIPSIHGLATEEYVGSKVAELVNSAPSTLDTLQELATALGNDPNFATTVANQIGTKASTEYVNTELAKKVNNEGYVATENNYSTAEKRKLQNVEEGANNYTHPENHEASMITQDETHRFVTDTERQTWNNKSDGDHNHDNSYAQKSSEHTHVNMTVLDTITTEKIQTWDNKSDFNGSYNSLTDKPIIPSIEGLATKTDLNNKVDKEEGKSLIEDIEIQRLKSIKNYDDSELKASLESKADKTDLHNHNNKQILDSINQGKITEWDSKSNFDGNYNSLTNKPNIPVVDVTKQYVDTQLATKSDMHEHPYLSQDTVIPSRLSQLENDSNFITSIPNEYVTDSELINKGYITNESIENKADRSELHNHSNKSLLDNITQDKVSKWDKSVIYENSTISNANDWKTTGYRRTSNNTTNLPQQCTADVDKWGVLQTVKENDTMGTQMFYPIDGTYKGRVFVRALFRDNWNSWTLLSTFSGSYNDLTNKPESFTPTSHRHDASEIDDLPTGESIDFGAENNWTGVNTFNNLVKLVHDNEVQRIEPTNANSACFYAFYKNKQNRSGHIGFESSSNNTFVIGNEMSNADIDMITKGSGRLKTNGKEVATQEALTNTIGNHKIWSGTQQEYDAIGTKDVNTLYFIKEEQNV